MQAKRRRKHRYAASLGGMYIIFAVLGVLTVVYICIQMTVRVLDNSGEKIRFENIIRPVVMFNPAPFEKPEDIEMPTLLVYSMWATLLGEKRDTYQFGENAELVIPASDLDVAAAKLFGPDVKLTHQSFGDYDMFYYYDEEHSIYNVPLSAQLNVYSPSVEEITKKGEYLELRVGYIPPGISWQTDFNGGKGQPAPEKYMNYIMRQSKDGYYIVKVQDPDSATILTYQNQQPESPQSQNAVESPPGNEPEALTDGE